VLLVVDASGMARTIGAIAHGFAGLDPEVCLAGLICSRVGSKSHMQLLRDATSKPPMLGAMPKDGAVRFPERQLGLRTASEGAVREAILSSWGEIVRSWCDLDSMVALARQAPDLKIPSTERVFVRILNCKIGLAFDEAFHFHYEDKSVTTRVRRRGVDSIFSD